MSINAVAARKLISTFVAVSTEKVDPKVRNATLAVTLTGFVTGVIVSGLNQWHAFHGLGGTVRDYVSGAIFSIVAGVVTWTVGYWTSHGEPILERVEHEAAAVIGPGELATAVADIKAAIVDAVTGQPPAAVSAPVVVQAAAPVIVQAPADSDAPTNQATDLEPDTPAPTSVGASADASPVLDLSGLTAA